MQSTLTIDNLISFLTTSGNSILLGDKKILQKLVDFSEHQSRVYARTATHLQHLQDADRAWSEKNYINFIKCIDEMKKELLPQSYLKKYKIATDKVHR